MKKLFLSFAALLSIALTGCEVDYDEKPTAGTSGFNLSYHINSPTSATTRTSVSTEDGEDQINSFYVLFFESTSGGTGRFLSAVDAMEAYDTALGTSGSLDIDYPAGLNNSTAYNLLLCANIEAYTSTTNGLSYLKALCSGRTESEVISVLQLEITGVTPGMTPQEEQTDDSHRMAMTDLPMSAQATKGAKQDHISVELIRTVSRFDVFNQASGYVLATASVWNGMTEAPLWETIFNDYSAARTERYYGVRANASHEIVGSLYAFENYVAKPEQNDSKSTCLIIGLLNTATGSIEYFRTNIHATNMGQQLKRNNVYRTTVMSVNGPGAGNEREAYGSDQLLIDVDINGWTLDDSGSVWYDGDNILALPSSEINLSGDGETREYNIFALGDATLSIKDRSLPGTVTASLNGKVLTLRASAGSSYQSGSITFSFGNIEATMRVNQLAPAQQPEAIDLSIYELPAFVAQKGQVSSDIRVTTTSGGWVAEIFNGNYFSFSNGSSQVTKIEGNSGESFNVQTILDNTDNESRFSFVQVRMKNYPTISRVIVLEQKP